mmetsp:Transcript_9235/g.29402  ORF Transcript_9235/g.29402 Transcript_9235/m.29402 type:complete len:235 (+) Transcript_9235:1419-2123(+)
MPLASSLIPFRRASSFAQCAWTIRTRVWPAWSARTWTRTSLLCSARSRAAAATTTRLVLRSLLLARRYCPGPSRQPSRLRRAAMQGREQKAAARRHVHRQRKPKPTAQRKPSWLGQAPVQSIQPKVTTRVPWPQGRLWAMGKIRAKPPLPEPPELHGLRSSKVSSSFARVTVATRAWTPQTVMKTSHEARRSLERSSGAWVARAASTRSASPTGPCGTTLASCATTARANTTHL